MQTDQVGEGVQIQDPGQVSGSGLRIHDRGRPEKDQENCAQRLSHITDQNSQAGQNQRKTEYEGQLQQPGKRPDPERQRVDFLLEG